ncbi:pilus assembly protein PilP [Candidatus Albibeggiatoa sp. nov. BB20]|uniref:pilus assembly protein PilP n=1 Tax=Candidatus Albibeggiatoa sp. nov. BB20 TaxID=3162723 RepID=UPI003365A90A
MNQRTLPHFIFISLFSLMLGACSNGNMDDLRQYVTDIKARQNPQVDPIPSFTIIPNHFYEVENKRDPFRPMEDLTTGGTEDTLINLGSKRNCERPDPYRIRAGLELLPLDALDMAGTLLDGQNNLWGLVTARSERITYRVQIGDYIGENNGEVIYISENKIEIRELYPDGSGCYVEQISSIALSSD